MELQTAQSRPNPPLQLNRFQKITTCLYRQLPTFGLNPFDWELNLDDEALKKVEVRHRLDREFRLEAEIEQSVNGHMMLRQIKLSSL